MLLGQTDVLHLFACDLPKDSGAFDILLRELLAKAFSCSTTSIFGRGHVERKLAS